MRQYLLPETGNFYKANLHCHTLISDGRKTPEEVKEIYKSHGYSVVAFTDHNVQVPHSELADPDFLPMTGVEYNLNNFGYPGKNREVKTCHLCFVATRSDIPYQVCYTDSYVNHGHARDYISQSMIDPEAKDFPRSHTPECINEMIRQGREAGYFITYNHPNWSQERWDDYKYFHGMHAMEIFNFGCINAGYDDYNSQQYNDLLRNGERIYCIGADDNHNKHELGDPLCDSLGAWIQIKAEKLEYNTIGKALLDGHFYTSMGPEIRNLWVEDGMIHVDCSDAVTVDVIYGVKYAQRARMTEGGDYLNSADFKIRPGSKWFRLRIRDARGNTAETNAYFLDELGL